MRTFTLTLICIAALCSGVRAGTQTRIVVAQDGSGDVKSVQQAIELVPDNNQRHVTIVIRPGVYKQQVRIPASKPYISFLGEKAESTILTFDLSNPQVGSTSATYSTYIAGHDFSAENITFENSFGTGAQAVALLVEADRAVFKHCRLLGWQDTLYAKGGRQYYESCYIEGHVDFIFGAATAVFENCQIHSKGAGYVTAPMRFSTSEPTGFVFHKCNLTGVNTGAGVFLGRPWRPYGRVVLLECKLDAHIRKEGWDNWRDPEREKTAWFAEFASTGAGADQSGRVKWAHQLSAEEARPYATLNFLAMEDGWNPLKADLVWQLAHKPAFKVVTWHDVLNQRVEWYATDEAMRVADNIGLYQRSNGGWPKNIDMAAALTEQEKAAIAKDRNEIDTTIDNGATHTQLECLARIFTAKQLERHKVMFLKGLDFLLSMQYENGGFPQYFPLREGYYNRITYNDGAMIGALKVLRAIADGAVSFTFVDAERRAKATLAVQRGIECILKTQVVVKGVKTVWCAQHDEATLAPAPARAYELVSLSGYESLGIVEFLLEIPNPDQRVTSAVKDAVAWFQKAQLNGIRWVEELSKDGRLERSVRHDAGAPPLWARFYELGTNRPMFVGRNGVIKYNVAAIEAERRNGYRWYVTEPARLLERTYPAWLLRIAK
jgi:PelA/Pel-15E family pectate lyase